MRGPLYDFEEEVNVPAFKRSTLRAFEARLNEEERPKLAFDSDYLAYLKVAHGRALRNCWFTHGKQRLPVDRVFSYARPEDLKGPPQPSWRPGADDVRMDYSVPYIGGMPNWMEDYVIVPFAGVGVNEMAEYDMLCFHFQFKPKPAVVLWEHEKNAREFKVVEFVARDFAEFTKLVVAAGRKKGA